jgi:tetratricopeptide (TPR) repeat protein
VLRRNPANPAALFWINQAYAWSGKHTAAREALERAMAIAPEGGFARLHPWYTALTAFAAGDYEEVLPPANAQLVISPTYGACLAIAAVSAFMVGDEAAARAFVVKAKTENPHLRPEKLLGMFTSQHDREKGAREYQILEQLWTEPSATVR